LTAVGGWRGQAIANAKASEVELTEEEIWTIRKAVDRRNFEKIFSITKRG
jgi:hypothetical protein